MAKQKVEKFYRKIWRFGRFAFCTVECYRKTDADRELNRQKYLRCESLIKVCIAKSQIWMCRYFYAETDAYRKICFDSSIHYNIRAEFLRKLSDKFKDGK